MKTRTGPNARHEYWYEGRWFTVAELAERWSISESYFYKLGKSYKSFIRHDAKYGIARAVAGRISAEDRRSVCLEGQGLCEHYKSCWQTGLCDTHSVECKGHSLDTTERAYSGKCHGINRSHRPTRINAYD